MEESVLPVLYKQGTNNILVVLLPPGVGVASHFSDLANHLYSLGYSVLSVSYPGAFGCSCTQALSVSEIATTLTDEIKIIPYQQLVLVGESYGGNVALEIASNISCDQIFLFGTGEYFSFIQKIILTSAFMPGFIHPLVCTMLARLLVTLSLFDLNKSGADPNYYQVLCKRWIDIIWFKLRYKQIYCTDIHYFIAQKDQIVNKKSYGKLNNFYPQIQFTTVPVDHFQFMDYLKNDTFELLSSHLIR